MDTYIWDPDTREVQNKTKNDTWDVDKMTVNSHYRHGNYWITAATIEQELNICYWLERICAMWAIDIYKLTNVKTSAKEWRARMAGMNMHMTYSWFNVSSILIIIKITTRTHSKVKSGRLNRYSNWNGWMMQYRKESCVITGNGPQINHLANAIKQKILISLMAKEEKSILQSLHVTFITLIGNLLR